MKRTVAILLSFFFFLSVGLSKVPCDSTYEEEKDSVIVQVQFENPITLIDDNRTLQMWTEFIETKFKTDSAFIGTFDKLISEYKTSQERRYESAMDYLQRISGWSEEKISTTLHKNTQLKRIAILLFLIVFALIYSLGVAAKTDVKIVFLFWFIFFILELSVFLLTYIKSDFYQLHQLIKLAG